MKKITLFLAALFVASMCFAELTVTPLWEFSTTGGNIATVVDDVKNGIAISPDGTKLYLSTRTADASQVAIYDPATGVRTGYLPALAGFASNYGGDVAVDGNGAIYASNVIISASALKIAKWDNATATPTIFVSTTAHTGSGTNRIGYGMDVRINSAGDGFIIMHKNGTSNFLIWTITANVPTSQDPTIITAGTAITDSYARISIIDDNNFWVDGNVARPWLATITKSGTEINATPTAIALTGLAYRTDVNVGVGGMTEFSLVGKRYGVIAANNHGAGYAGGHHSLLQELSTAATVTGTVIADLPLGGLGTTGDASHFVESVVYVNGDDAYIYSMGGFNGITATKVSAPAPATKTFTVTVPNGTEKVYIVGAFTGKAWNETDPFELTATANPNEFTGTFPCVDGVEYQYLCEKGDWDYVDAVYDGGNDPVKKGNRTYTSADNVPIWFRVNKITFNASIAAGGIPNELYINGGFNAWAGTLMTKSGEGFSYVLGGNPGDKYPANTKYKYSTNEMVEGNWEAEAGGGNKGDRWSIAPVMNDVIAQFITPIPGTGFSNASVDARITRTSNGINVTLSGESTVEIYTINGMMIDKTIANGNYSRDLNNGIYIIRINGKATKFLK